MKISRYLVEPCTLPDEDPEWKMALFAYPKNEACIVHLEAEDGTVGQGYAAAFPHLAATQAGVAQVLERLCEMIVGRDALAIEDNLALVQKGIKGNHAAKSGIDCALYDLAAQLLDVPLYRLFGGKVRDRVPLLRILAIKSPDQMAEKALQLVDQGYRFVKLKVAGDLLEDVARVRAVRKAVGPDVGVTVDPNQSYRAKSAIRFIRRIEEFQVDLIEQPVREDDLKGLALVTANTETTIEADESASTVEQLMGLASDRRVDAISLKVSKAGGLRNVQTMARLCEINHLGCRMGATVGSQLLAAHALHLTASLPNMDYACELAEFEHLTNDPFEGLTVEDGDLIVPDASGSGVRRRDETVSKLAGAR